MRLLFTLGICFFHLGLFAQYTGTGSVSQGKALTTISNLYTCTGGRITNLGQIKSTDNLEWIVPADNNFTEVAFPFSSDLYNSCIGANYKNVSEAIAALNETDIIEVDPDGELITAYIFADNYFEMYINGKAVGKDKVPFTQFNSSIVRFKVKRPFTIAMLLVDWEENLGLGSELNGGFAYHPGDGGMVAVFKDINNQIIAITNNEWKAQTFYTSPIKDLSCPSEIGMKRLSDKCDVSDSNNGLNYYALHWKRPNDVMSQSFDDRDWPNASVFTNTTVGVNNKPSYTNFVDVFDDPKNDAQFIWSTNVVLDNEVIVRFTVLGTNSTSQLNLIEDSFKIFPIPCRDKIWIQCYDKLTENNVEEISIIDLYGRKVFNTSEFVTQINVEELLKGIYVLQIKCKDHILSKKILIE